MSDYNNSTRERLKRSLEAATVHTGPIITVYDGRETVKAVRLDRLHIPIHIALGRYEAATQEELDDIIADLKHEATRRSRAARAT